LKKTENIKYLSKDFKLPSKLSITNGFVHLIRFLRSNKILIILGKKYTMPSKFEYEYIWATIDTSQEKLFIYHDNKQVTEI